uniref:Uncharacterized protein n=1 Tax=Peronospora matthiolae TaxID=2874970 RepID=A0AAV1T1P6_9STRA
MFRFAHDDCPGANVPQDCVALQDRRYVLILFTSSSHPGRHRDTSCDEAFFWLSSDRSTQFDGNQPPLYVLSMRSLDQEASSSAKHGLKFDEALDCAHHKQITDGVMMVQPTRPLFKLERATRVTLVFL